MELEAARDCVEQVYIGQSGGSPIAQLDRASFFNASIALGEHAARSWASSSLSFKPESQPSLTRGSQSVATWPSPRSTANAREPAGPFDTIGEFGLGTDYRLEGLVEDLFRPFRLEQPGLGEADQEVTQRSRIQHVGVVGGDEGHDDDLRSVLEADLLCLAGELVGDLSTKGLASTSIVQEVVEQDLATVSDPSVWDDAVVEKLDQERPAHVQEVSGLLAR
jgi:hypothetical protein